jgi:hypothetical protein
MFRGYRCFRVASGGTAMTVLDRVGAFSGAAFFVTANIGNAISQDPAWS